MSLVFLQVCVCVFFCSRLDFIQPRWNTWRFNFWSNTLVQSNPSIYDTKTHHLSFTLALSLSLCHSLGVSNENMSPIRCIPTKCMQLNRIDRVNFCFGCTRRMLPNSRNEARKATKLLDVSCSYDCLAHDAFKRCILWLSPSLCVSFVCGFIGLRYCCSLISA